MRKRKSLFIVCMVIVIFLLSTFFGYTYSKYVDSEDVIGSSSVAKWNFNGAISNTAETTTKSISLAETISKDSIVTGKIAPGTKGIFKIIIDASGSEVDLDYDVVLKGEESTKPTNLYFTCEDLINGKNEKFYSLKEMLKIDDSSQRSNMSGKITKDNNKEAKVITVNWEWPYETRDQSGILLDEQDTLDSKIPDYNFTLNIIGKQVKEE